jgi:hypothetical protein
MYGLRLYVDNTEHQAVGEQLIETGLSSAAVELFALRRNACLHRRFGCLCCFMMTAGAPRNESKAFPLLFSLAPLSFYLTNPTHPDSTTVVD